MSTPDQSQSPQGEASPAGKAANVPPPAGSNLASGPGKLAAAAGLAAILVWSVMLARGYPFFPEPQPAAAGGAGVPTRTDEELAAMARRAYLNLATLMAISGGFLGVGMALAEGVRRRPTASVFLAVLAAALAGGCAGVAAAWCADRMFELPDVRKLDQWTPGASDVLIQGVCWGVVGFGVAAGLTLSGCRHPRALLGGALAGLFSALLYAIIAALTGILLPVAETAGLVPDSTLNRLLWLIAAAVCIGTGLGAAGGGRRAGVRG